MYGLLGVTLKLKEIVSCKKFFFEIFVNGIATVTFINHQTRIRNQTLIYIEVGKMDIDGLTLLN